MNNYKIERVGMIPAELVWDSWRIGPYTLQLVLTIGGGTRIQVFEDDLSSLINWCGLRDIAMIASAVNIAAICCVQCRINEAPANSLIKPFWFDQNFMSWFMFEFENLKGKELITIDFADRNRMILNRNR